MPPGILLFRWFAKVYGWTPAQVRDLDIDLFEWLPAIEAADAEAAHMATRAEEARYRKPGRG